LAGFCSQPEEGAQAGGQLRPFWNEVSVRIFKLLISPGIDSKESIPPALVACAGIFKQSVRARNRVGVGIGLSYRPARLHSLAELVPWNLFLGSLKVENSGSWRAGTTTLFLLGSFFLSPHRLFKNSGMESELQDLTGCHDLQLSL
jgi:hypothetical protein